MINMQSHVNVKVRACPYLTDVIIYKGFHFCCCCIVYPLKKKYALSHFLDSTYYQSKNDFFHNAFHIISIYPNKNLSHNKFAKFFFH